jgi:hypothetical protein
MKHPSPGALLELHFEEFAGAERGTLTEHVRECRPCGALVEEVRRLETALAAGPDDAPPPDGLERILARIAVVQPALTRRVEWARAVVPSALALLAGWWATRAGAERLATLGLVPGTFAGPFSGDLLGLSLSALGVVAFGALVTLALAPVLILESYSGMRRAPLRACPFRACPSGTRRGG